MTRILILAALFGAGDLLAQDAAPLPSFEVASIKPSGPYSRTIGMHTYRGGRVTAENLTLAYLIQEAFSVQDFQISGGPNWIRQDRFDLDARPPANSKSSKADPYMSKLPPNEEQRQMLQSLLLDRFQLKLRRETREGPVYFLIKTNRPFKLSPSKNDREFPWVGSPQGGMVTAEGIAGTNVTLPLIAERLSRFVGRPIIDRTGIAGAFDFEYKYSAPGEQADLLSAILGSVQALGLKLEPGKAPVETIVIDSAAKPSPN